MFKRKPAPAPDPLVVRVDRQLIAMVEALEARQQYLRTVLRQDLEELHEVEARLAHISSYSAPPEDPLIESLADALQDSLKGLDDFSLNHPIFNGTDEPEPDNTPVDRRPETHPQDPPTSGT